MNNTHFGYETVDETQKAGRVKAVFDSVAPYYDMMNDLMSLGLHRFWKAYTVMVANIRPGMRVLDLASGTGDLALAFASKVGSTGLVLRSDINEIMLNRGSERLLDKGIIAPGILADAEALPFSDQAFDVVSLAFGLRNMTHKERVLQETHRVLRPGGKVLLLEFSKVAKVLQKPYDFYSFKLLPKLGRWIAKDGQSYRYLAESIRMHPDQQTLKKLMHQCGFGHVDIHNLSAGITALHVGIKC
jgi:demethylmenaquinone methyltransferase/2-methoxy-6-polyprenyl-1,4-benzoquinol methylase